MKTGFFVIIIFAALALNSRASGELSFDFESSTIAASDVILVSQDERLDGHFTVLEAWKGGLKPGDALTVPELAVFAPTTNRTIGGEVEGPGEMIRFLGTTIFGQPTNGPTSVSGRRMCLFLERSTTGPLKWSGADRSGIPASSVWIE